MDTNVKRTVTSPRMLEYIAKPLTASIRYACPLELSLLLAETYSTMAPVTSPKNHIIRGMQMPDMVAHMTAMMIPKTSSHVAYRYCKNEYVVDVGVSFQLTSWIIDTVFFL